MRNNLYNIDGKRIFVAGHRGMVGSALMRKLDTEVNCEILVAGRDAVDLTRQQAVEAWMEQNRPELVFLAAAKVGGISANDAQPAEFLYENLMIEANIIEAARKTGVDKLVFLGSTCIYPKFAPQPMPEETLLTGPLEPTNEWYAIAKIAGIKLCQAYRKQYGCDFIAAQPTNLYGPGDNYDLQTSHVLPALLRKAHEAKIAGAGEMQVWGSGEPLREFCHVDDLADAVLFLTRHYSDGLHINIGTGLEVSIRELAELIADIVGFEGELVFDRSKPDGTPRKLADVTRLKEMGWQPQIGLKEGIKAVYRDWLEMQPSADNRRQSA